MSARELLDFCQAAGIALSANGENLHVGAPAGLPAGLRARLIEHKPELLALLADEACKRIPQNPGTQDDPDERRYCRTCRHFQRKGLLRGICLAWERRRVDPSLPQPATTTGRILDDMPRRCPCFASRLTIH